jgi:hypothetical protein
MRNCLASRCRSTATSDPASENFVTAAHIRMATARSSEVKARFSSERQASNGHMLGKGANCTKWCHARAPCEPGNPRGGSIQPIGSRNSGLSCPGNASVSCRLVQVIPISCRPEAFSARGMEEALCLGCELVDNDSGVIGSVFPPSPIRSYYLEPVSGETGGSRRI